MTPTRPSPYQAARQVSENFGPVVQNYGDRSSIEDIFEQISESGRNPEDFMEQILTRVSPNNREAAAKILQSKQQKINSRKQNQFYESQGFSEGFSSLSEGERKEYIKDRLTKKEKKDPLEKEKLERKERTRRLLNTSKRLKDLLPYTGATEIPFTKSFGGGKVGFNREAVQKREEFDTLAADYAGFFRDLDTKGQLPQGLYDKVIAPRLPSTKLSERENLGRINALERLAKDYGGEEEEIEESSETILRARNPNTGEIIQSSDGGQTWQPI